MDTHRFLMRLLALLAKCRAEKEAQERAKQEKADEDTTVPKPVEVVETVIGAAAAPGYLDVDGVDGGETQADDELEC